MLLNFITVIVVDCIISLKSVVTHAFIQCFTKMNRLVQTIFHLMLLCFQETSYGKVCRKNRTFVIKSNKVMELNIFLQFNNSVLVHDYVKKNYNEQKIWKCIVKDITRGNFEY